MNKPAIEATIVGLKCDAEGCDYRNDDIPCDEYELWIDTPCPECGASLLTQADFELVQTLTAFSDAINDIFPPGSFPDDEPRAEFQVKMDGSGIPQVGEIKWEETDET